MKKKQLADNRKYPTKYKDVMIDPALDRYNNEERFPEKLAKANEFFKTAKLPSDYPKDHFPE